MVRDEDNPKLWNMFKRRVLVVLCCSTLLFNSIPVNAAENEDRVSRKLEQFDSEYNAMAWLQQSAEWSSSTNLSASTTAARSFAFGSFTDWMKGWKLWARSLDRFSYPEKIEKVLSIIASGIVFMDADDAREMSRIRSKMSEIYNTAKIVLPSADISIKGEHEAQRFMSESKDPQLLKKVWTAWREETGNKVKPLYLDFVDLLNRAARQNNYPDIGASWREELAMTDVVSTARHLWDEVKDFYKEIHAYARRRLLQIYGAQIVEEDGPIPVHLLGSLWGESWTPLLVPFPSQKLADVKSKGFNVTDIFVAAEKMYTSMGMKPMTKSFWEKSMFQRPENGVVDCHSAAYDFSRDQDYRIRMCGEVSAQSLQEAVHEIGHIEYYMAYSRQPMIYRNGANSAFHEAVGETMVYGTQNPKCLEKLGFLDTAKDSSTEDTLNLLMKQALSKFVFLPWALTVDLWRYKLFNGEIKASDMTSEWWQLRKELQGVKPPDEESSNAFDAGSKYHVINNMPYMRYFFSRFLEHQFLDGLCREAEQDIHSCCLIGSSKAGDLMSRMMSFGSSTSWQDALEVMTGQRHLSAKPMLRYYKPLYRWLKQQNANATVY